MGLSFLSPWFLLGRARGGAADRAAPAAQGNRAGARVRGGALPAAGADRAAAAAPPARSAAAGAARRARCCCWRRRSRGRTSRGEDAVGGDHHRRGRHVVQHGRAGPHGEGARGRGAGRRRRAGGDRVAVIRFDDRATRRRRAEPRSRRGARRDRRRLARRAAAPPPHAAVERRDAPRRRGAGPARARQRSRSRASGRRRSPTGLTLETSSTSAGRSRTSPVGPARRDGDAVVAEVTNHGIRARKAQVVLAVNDRSVADAAVAIEPGATASVRLAGAAADDRRGPRQRRRYRGDAGRRRALPRARSAAARHRGAARRGGRRATICSFCARRWSRAGRARGFAVEMLGGDARARSARRRRAAAR